MRRIGLLIGLMALFASCMPRHTIKKIYFDKERHCYIAEMDKNRVPLLVRDAEGRIVQDKATLKSMMTNRQLPNHIIEININRVKDADAYRCGEQYAAGLREARAGRFRKALSHFDSALKKYPKVIKWSDIHYLMAFCHLSLENRKEGIKHLEFFLHFSRQILPAVFNTDITVNKQSILLVKAARSLLKALQNGETINSRNMIAYHEKVPVPALLISLLTEGYTIGSNLRTSFAKFYGSFGRINSPEDAHQVGTIGFGYLWDVHKNLDILPVAAWSSNAYVLSSDFRIQLYRSDNNRFGLTLSPELTAAFSQNSGENLFKADAGIVASGFPLLQVQLFAGIKARIIGDDFYYHGSAGTVRYSEDRIRYKLGAVWEFIPGFSFKAEYDTGKIIMSLSMVRLADFGYNFTDKQWTCQLYRYHF